MRALFRFLFLVIVFAGLAAWWLRFELTSPYYEGKERETYVDIPRGAASERIAQTLEENGVIHSRLALIAYLRWKDMGKHLQAGEYRFAVRATPIDVAARLARGDIYFISLTIPEGLTAMDVAGLVAHHGLADSGEMSAALSRTDFIRDLDPEATNLEGYLFPETYRFSRHATAEEIVHTMVQRFRDVFQKLQSRSPVPAGWNVRGIVTLASMIEKEATSDAERNLVASVLTNRIVQRMPLACDPTVIYGMRLEGRYDGNIRKADLGMNSPYNTYVHLGLPPGPVSSPGTSSLSAALSPAKTDFLYFVSRNDGTHQFSKDYRAHASAVARFQKSPGR